MSSENAQAGPSTPRRSFTASSPSEESPAGFERWRSSLAQFTGLGLSDNEKAARDERLAQKKLEKDWDQCEKWKRQLMERSES